MVIQAGNQMVLDMQRPPEVAIWYVEYIISAVAARRYDWPMGNTVLLANIFIACQQCGANCSTKVSKIPVIVAVSDSTEATSVRGTASRVCSSTEAYGAHHSIIYMAVYHHVCQYHTVRVIIANAERR